MNPAPDRVPLLAVLALVELPMLWQVPAWIAALAVAALLWRVLVERRGWPLPGRPLRAALTLLAFAAVWAGQGTITGLEAGASLLLAMTALKLTELRNARDVFVLVLLMYFLLATLFLFTQAPWTFAYLLAGGVLVTAVLVREHGAGRVSLRAALRLALSMNALALPLALLMFVLFPRLPGPLWGLPPTANQASGGLADSMAPGQIAALARSGRLAFRVWFEGAVPPPALRYWRGPVFTHFDGRRWTAGPQARPEIAPEIQYGADRYRYTITLEPNRSRWLPALDLPLDGGLPMDVSMTTAASLRAHRDDPNRRRYRLVSAARYRLQPDLPARVRAAALQLPAHADPRARALALRWRHEGLDAAAIVGRALRLFADGGFRYTLRPPAVGREEIDDFLFRTRAGFCEHYAAAFTFLMRAAGIPARVVTGYQGGHYNRYGDFYAVTAADAHAWSEVWLPRLGWTRFDPTAAVAPARIDSGLDAASDAAATNALRSGDAWLRLRNDLAARWAAVNARWDRWVLGYGPQLQARLLGRFGLNGMRAMLLALTGGVALMLGVFAVVLLRGPMPRRRPTDPALRLWQRALRRLRRRGIRQAAGEGPRDFLRRAAATSRGEPAHPDALANASLTPPPPVPPTRPIWTRSPAPIWTPVTPRTRPPWNACASS